MLLNTEIPEPLAALQWGGLRFRFADNLAAGRAVLPILNESMFSAMVYEVLLSHPAEYRDAMRGMMTLAHCFELLRDHPAYPRADQEQWLEIFSGYVDNLRVQVHEPTTLETIWLGALNVIAGIVLERVGWFETGVAIYRHAIGDVIHQDGYLLGVANTGDGWGFENQISAITALVLTAEAAGHVGVDLWSYNVHDVSISTAVAYPLAYYSQPEKWPWDAGLRETDVTRICRHCCGFLEIVNRHHEETLKSIKPILAGLRPVYECHGGGLTTLSHALVKRLFFK